MPKVSVLTPIYNTNPMHLRECIDSILGQSFTDFEFIILNDSPDNTEIENIVKSYEDKRIRYYRNEQNCGITASRNRLLELAEGQYLAVFDHDDISTSDRLEKQVAYLDANPDIGAVSANTQWFPQHRITDHPQNNLEIKAALMHMNVFMHTAMMVRKSILTENNIKYEEKYSPAEDYMLALKLAGCTMLHNLPDILVLYRYDGVNNTTNKQWNKMMNADAWCRDYAARNYPYMYSICAKSNHAPSTVVEHHCWLRLFDLVPVIKVKYKTHRIRWYLLGLIPVMGIKR